METQNFTQSLETLNLQISNHAMDRYKERVRNNQTNILDEETKNKYTVEIKKLYLSSELMYTGVIGHSSGEVEVYINRNGWVLICGKNQKQVITLYKVDLNVGDDELNQVYITKSIEKILSCKETINTIADQVETNKINYMEELDTNNALLKEYKKQIEALTLRNDALNNLIKTEDAKIYQAKIKLRNALEDFMVKDKCKVEIE